MIVGLVLEIIGAVLIAVDVFYPIRVARMISFIFSPYHGWGPLEPNPEHARQEEAHRTVQKVGVFILVIGLVLQIVAVARGCNGS